MVGEAQSYKYALQDVEPLKKAIKGEEGFKDMTPIEALGYVGLTALGVAGMTPIVGPYARKAASGIRSLMPKRGQRTTEQARVQDLNNNPGFNYFVSNLPEYRQTPEGQKELALEKRKRLDKDLYQLKQTRQHQTYKSSLLKKCAMRL